MIVKFTMGYVKQEFNDDGTLVKQEFIATDSSQFEDEHGRSIDPVDFYHNFDMKNCYEK